MAARQDDGPRPLDLRGLDLAPGEARELEIPLQVGDILLGGQRYVTEPAEPVARLEASQSASGRHFRLRLRADLIGPCWRCLTDARIELEADVRDFAAFGRPPGAAYDEDLDCEYLDGDALDAVAMGRDALIDLVPAIILCREECAGLCPVCGTNLNDGSCACEPVPPDDRWAALREVADRLAAGDGG